MNSGDGTGFQTETAATSRQSINFKFLFHMTSWRKEQNPVHINEGLKPYLRIHVIPLTAILIRPRWPHRKTPPVALKAPLRPWKGGKCTAAPVEQANASAQMGFHYHACSSPLLQDSREECHLK